MDFENLREYNFRSYLSSCLDYEIQNFLQTKDESIALRSTEELKKVQSNLFECLSEIPVWSKNLKDHKSKNLPDFLVPFYFVESDGVLNLPFLGIYKEKFTEEFKSELDNFLICLLAFIVFDHGCDVVIDEPEPNKVIVSFESDLTKEISENSWFFSLEYHPEKFGLYSFSIWINVAECFLTWEACLQSALENGVDLDTIVN